MRTLFSSTRCAFSLTLLAALIPGAALAQTGGDDDKPASDDIVVIGRELAPPPGTPAYGSVWIGRQRLANEAGGRIENVLADVAGFQQFRRSDSRASNPSAQGATLRAIGGNASSRTLILLDGVPVADPFFGYIPFSAITPDRLGGIRVTRGGGAGPFGAGAVAGTIELFSANDGPVLAAEGFAGSRDAQSLSTTLAPQLGSGFLSVSGRFDRGDGFDTTPAGQRAAATVPSRYRSWSSQVRMVAPLSSDTDLQFRALAFGDNRTLRFRGADSSSQGQDASVRLLARGPWKVDALAYLQSRNFSNKVISGASFRLTLDQRNTPSMGYGGKIELRPPVSGRHVLRIGADLRGADGELFEDAYSAAGAVTARRNAGGKITSAGLFVEDDWVLGPLVLTGGARVDRWAIRGGFFREANGGGATVIDNRFAGRMGTEWTGRAGALLHADRAIDLRVAAYTGFRLPTLNELYRPFTVFPVTTQANAALAPERLRGIEGGIDVRPATGLSFGLTGFVNRLDDAIGNVTIGANLRRRDNIDAIEAKGIELTLDWHIGAIGLTASYAYSDSRVVAPGTALNGLAPAQSPRSAASATISWAPRGGMLMSFTLRHVGDQFEDDLQTDTLPAATTADAMISVPLGSHVAIVARGENVFDERVVTRNQGGSIDLGAPRTLWIGLRVTE